MTVSDAPTADRLDLIELAFRYGTVVDDRDWPALACIFTDDVEFDITDFAGTVISGLDALIALMDSPTARHPVAHLITNVFVESLAPMRGTMRSRLLAVQTDGSVYVGSYRDEVIKGHAGWRIQRRVCSYVRRPDGS
jgi:3-phenylpropionate/cinnamic acid dioxygenase small subunit